MTHPLLFLATLASLCALALAHPHPHVLDLAKRHPSALAPRDGQASLPALSGALSAAKSKYALNGKVLTARRKAYERTGCKAGASFARAFGETLESELAELLGGLAGGLLGRERRMERVSHSRRASEAAKKVQSGKLTDKEYDSYWT